MRKILMPVDGSSHSERLARFVAAVAPGLALDVHLLNVCEPIDFRARAFMTADEVAREGERCALRDSAAARAVLDQAGVPYRMHWVEGEPAAKILDECGRLGCDHIVMGTRGMNAIAAALVGSVAMSVIGAAAVPVTLIR